MLRIRMTFDRIRLRIRILNNKKGIILNSKFFFLIIRPPSRPHKFFTKISIQLISFTSCYMVFYGRIRFRNRIRKIWPDPDPRKRSGSGSATLLVGALFVVNARTTFVIPALECCIVKVVFWIRLLLSGYWSDFFSWVRIRIDTKSQNCPF